MSQRKRFNSVAEMAKGLLDSDASQRLNKRLSERQFIKALVSLRAISSMSQEDLAGKLGCTQGKISKLESSNDQDIRFGDFVQYATAVDNELRIFIVPKGQSLVNEVKMHAFVIKRHLDCLVQLAKNDEAISAGVASFFEEAALNLTRIVNKAAEALPKSGKKKPSIPFQVEIPQVHGEDEPPPAAAANPKETLAGLA